MTILYAVVTALTGGLSIFLLAMSFIPSKNPLASRIEKMQQVTERAHGMRLARFEEIAAGENVSRLRARLLEAGWYRVTPAAFALRGIAGFGFGICAGIVLYAVLPVKMVALLLAVILAFVGWRIPKVTLDRAIKQRKAAIDRALPDFLDLLSATVQAGLALNAAMIQATEAAVGPLHEELGSALAEIQLGRSRSDALRSMAERANQPQLETMVTAILQAEMLGGNISSILHELSAETRNRRWVLAEERAARLPVLMLFPMGFLMFPALYIVIFGPVVANFLKR